MNSRPFKNFSPPDITLMLTAKSKLNSSMVGYRLHLLRFLDDLRIKNTQALNHCVVYKANSVPTSILYRLNWIPTLRARI